MTLAEFLFFLITVLFTFLEMTSLEVPQNFEILALGNSANHNAESILKFKRILASKRKKLIVRQVIQTVTIMQCSWSSRDSSYEQLKQTMSVKSHS